MLRFNSFFTSNSNSLNGNSSAGNWMDDNGSVFSGLSIFTFVGVVVVEVVGVAGGVLEWLGSECGIFVISFGDVSPSAGALALSRISFCATGAKFELLAGGVGAFPRDPELPSEPSSLTILPVLTGGVGGFGRGVEGNVFSLSVPESEFSLSRWWPVYSNNSAYGYELSYLPSTKVF